MLGYAGQHADQYWRHLALVPARFNAWTLLTSSFLHVTPAHLLGNLLWLALFGSIVELAIRRYAYLFALLCGTVVASLTQMVVVLATQPDRVDTPIVGASGMVAAIIGMFAVRFYTVDLRVPLGARGVNFPSLWIVVIWLVPQFIGAVRTLVDNDGALMGYWGHLAGFVTGLALALMLHLHRAAARSYLSSCLEQATTQGDLIAASQAAGTLTQSQPDSWEAQLTAARAALDVGDVEAAITFYGQALKICDRRRLRAQAVEVMREVISAIPKDLVPTEWLFCWARVMAEHGYPREAVQMLHTVIEREPGSSKAESALAWAALIYIQRLDELAEAERLLTRLMHEYPNTPMIAYALDLLREAQRRQRQS